jgi:uncharacterized iron-regulated membrane protein
MTKRPKTPHIILTARQLTRDSLLYLINDVAVPHGQEYIKLILEIQEFCLFFCIFEVVAGKLLAWRILKIGKMAARSSKEGQPSCRDIRHLSAITLVTLFLSLGMPGLTSIISSRSIAARAQAAGAIDDPLRKADARTTPAAGSGEIVQKSGL